MYCQRKKCQARSKMAQILDFLCKEFNVDIMNMFKELKEIVFKELKENMVLIKESLQEN